VDEMIQVFKDFSTEMETGFENIPVTFAVRADIAQNSLGNLLYLLNATSHNSSITLWTGADDPKVNVTLIDDMFKLVGKRRTFVDLPYSDWKYSSGSVVGFNVLFMGFVTLLRNIVVKMLN
jgi:hypothetical protein